MDIETDLQLLPVASKPHTFTSKTSQAGSKGTWRKQQSLKIVYHSCFFHSSSSKESAPDPLYKKPKVYALIV